MSRKSPDKNGYSIGYPYLDVEENGEYEGVVYDSFQDLQALDHIALTNDERQPDAIKTIYDSENKVNKYFIGYDTYKTAIKAVNEKKEIKMTDELKELMAKNADQSAHIAKLETQMKISADSKEQLENKDRAIKDLEDKLKLEVDARENREELEKVALLKYISKWKIKPEQLSNYDLAALRLAKIIGDSVAELPRADDKFVEGDSKDDKEDTLGIPMYDQDKNEWGVI